MPTTIDFTCTLPPYAIAYALADVIYATPQSPVFTPFKRDNRGNVGPAADVTAYWYELSPGNDHKLDVKGNNRYTYRERYRDQDRAQRVVYALGKLGASITSVSPESPGPTPQPRVPQPPSPPPPAPSALHPYVTLHGTLLQPPYQGPDAHKNDVTGTVIFVGQSGSSVTPDDSARPVAVLLLDAPNAVGRWHITGDLDDFNPDDIAAARARLNGASA